MAQSTVDDITRSDFIDSYDPDNDPKKTDKIQLIDQIKKAVGTRGESSKWKKPLNVVVLGCPGSGKSAFLNTVFTSFRTDWWAERARVGNYGQSGHQVTRHVLRFDTEKN